MSSSLLVPRARTTAFEPRRNARQPHHSPSSLLYDTVGPCVRLRPTAPTAFRQALRRNAHHVQELTLLGFSEAAVADELYELIVEHMTALRTLRIVSLDLWSATHLQSTTALAVGPALGRIVGVPQLRVLHLQRVCMGRSPAHVQAWSRALAHHPSLEVLTMDTHSYQLGNSSNDNNNDDDNASALNLDPLVLSLATCPQLDTLQIYLSGYQRGCLHRCGMALAKLLGQLQEMSFHMVSLPSQCAVWIQAARQSRTLQALHWTHVVEHPPINDSSSGCMPWVHVLRGNTSLHAVSITVPAAQRNLCWEAIGQHPRISSAYLSLRTALTHVPAFEKHANHDTLDIPPEFVVQDEAETWAVAQALSQNPRLVQGPTSPQALVRLNQGPRSVYMRRLDRWWEFVANYTHDLDALWLLLRLHPGSVAH
mmetsp:Transcript_22700/g.43110  ORF Transcript_22700/g.43110 Transcript_22700/m.43110 type:complete len:424 (+) Transcript_22700:146-1417(+)